MNIDPIFNDQDLHSALRRLEGLFQAEPSTPEAAEAASLVAVIEHYENRHYPIPTPKVRAGTGDQGPSRLTGISRELNHLIGRFKF